MSPPPLPAGFGVALDPGVRVFGGGRTVYGGSPRKLLILSPPAAARLEAWRQGGAPETAADRTLARRLVDAGLAHPVPPPLGAAGPRPSVTVVIPVHDRPEELDRCLAALGAGDATVIAVDDASREPAPVADVARRHGARLLRHEVNAGPAGARNTGLAAATTDIVAFIDSDCVAHPGWLDRLLAHFADPLVGAVAPRIVALDVPRPGWLHRYEAARSHLDLGELAGPVVPQSRISYVPGAALAVRREAAGGGFDPAMRVGEDVDLVWRLHEAGWRVRFEPAARVAHDHRTRFGSWFGRRVDYGTSAALLGVRHPGRLAPAAASPWSGGFWALALAGRPGAAGGLAAVSLHRVRRRLAGTPGGDEVAVRLVVGGTLGAGRLLAEAATKAWFPLTGAAALASRRARRRLALAWLVPAASDWWVRGRALDPGRYAVARVLDDVAYCSGVWLGAWRQRTLEPLLPRRSRAPTSTDR